VWIITGAVLAIFAILLAVGIWCCCRCCRKAVAKRHRLCRHRAPPKADVPGIPKTSPGNDFDQSLEAVGPAPGPAIANQLPVEDAVDRATGKRVSFNVPGDDTIVKDFQDIGSPSNRSFEESKNVDGERARPASPR
jgi:hypothetical protein